MSDFVPVYKPSFVIEEQEGLFRITTGMARREKLAVYFYVAFVSLVALGFLFSPFLAFIVNPFDKARAIASFLRLSMSAVFVLAILGYVIVLVIKTTLKHIVEVTDKSIVIIEGDYNFYRSKKYAMAYVKNLRGSTYPGKKEGAVKFDYGSRTIAFGKSLDEAEANLIVQSIIKMFPSLRDTLG